MLQYRLVPFVIFICVLVLQQSIIECRPNTQQIIIDGHEWTVPNEPGWKEGEIAFEISLRKKTTTFILFISSSRS